MPISQAFGITAGSRPDHARLGSEVERLGYHELWVTDTRGADGLATLAELAPATSRLRFGVGVVALSEHPPERIAQRVIGAGLAPARLTLGVGSGSSRSRDLVRRGVETLRAQLPAHTKVAVAAVGPRMAHLAGAVADAVVANWSTPERLGRIRQRVAEGAAEAGRPEPRFVAYVRTAVGAGAEERLRREMARYRGFGAHYARALGEQEGALVGVAGPDPARVRDGLAPYRAVVDTLVVRGLPADDSVAGWLEIARAAADPLSAAS